VDGREQLRRYLEQRREAGERELVLDQMTVDEVLRLVGAKAEMSDPAASAVVAPPPRPPIADASSGDWRAVLAGTQRREAGPGVPPAAGVAPPARPLARVPAEAPIARPAPPRADAASATPARRPGDLERPPADPPHHAAAGAPQSPVRDAEARPPGIAVGNAHVDLFGGPLSRLETIDDLARSVASCTRCPLYATATNPVPGEGSPTAGLVCVGEAPGATEDATGRPFVGQAGKLLDKILGAIQLRREDVFICNVLKHRPPGNRNPLPDEVAACSPYLVRQLELIRPKVIVAFGTFAAQTLLQTKDSIGKLRGAVHRYYGVPLIVTYHPAALLRNPAWKRPTWEDVQYARRILDGIGV